MKLAGFPIALTNWSDIEPERHAGDSGYSLWRVQYFGEGSSRIRVRMVEHSRGYVSDHWCLKGHVIFCIAGGMDTHLKDGRVLKVRAGMSYQVADDTEAHSSRSETGATLFIVD